MIQLYRVGQSITVEDIDVQSVTLGICAITSLKAELHIKR